MTNITALSRPGQVNLAGDDQALWLKLFAGEVLTAFEEAVVMRDLVMQRNISQGKSAQFPAHGRASAFYHGPGENILDPANSLLSQIRSNERVITIDDLLIAAVFLDSLDEIKTHWDVRSVYSMEVGRALAKEMDVRLLRVAVLAARDTTALITDTPTGTGWAAGESIIDADFASNGASALATLFSIAQKFDEKDVPDDGRRYVVVPPQAYYTLVQQTDLLNRDFGGSNGIFSDGTIMKAAGLVIVKSNNLPRTNFTADAGEGNATTANFTNNIAVAFHQSALGTVKLRDLEVESEYLVQYQGNLIVAKYAMGHGILHNDAAIEVSAS